MPETPRSQPKRGAATPPVPKIGIRPLFPTLAIDRYAVDPRAVDRALGAPLWKPQPDARRR
jgi:hypothetical protein